MRALLIGLAVSLCITVCLFLGCKKENTDNEVKIDASGNPEGKVTPEVMQKLGVAPQKGGAPASK